ncbi:GNAT family N-acetyltransferase [Actinoplanes sp. GCM10030250]|uniref:GNAT family N-acetyltransferase n=1 Tax=Actinoplanes sp. GCM10030250 TaxID=3273376 RepID=UPI003616679E
MTVSLRPATADDQAGVGALHHRSRAAAYADQLDDPGSFAARGPEMFVEWWVERWKWEQETHRMIVAEDAGELIGFSYIGPSETAGAAELYAIHLDPDRIGTGVGRLLMIRALEELADCGAGRAVLWVLEGNKVARRFYERGGWTPDGATRVAPINDQPLPQVRYCHPL